VRGALVAAALLLAALTLLDRRADRRWHADFEGRLAALELPDAAAAGLAVVAREDDPAHRRLALARAVVGAEMPVLREGAEAAAAVERLETARQLAAEALAERPAAWEAPLLLGAATYLARRRAEDPRVVTEAAAWEGPLARARELAPTAPEPARVSAVAYLDLWPALSADKRRLARELLALAFRDAGSRRRMLAVWIDQVDDPEEAMALLPAGDPAAWREAQRAFEQRDDWRSAATARRRWRQALAVDLERRLEAAAEPRRRADPAAARREALRVIAEAPPDVAFVPLVERALGAPAPSGGAPDEAPDGPAAAGSRAWLEWSLDLALVGRQALPPHAVDRLAALAGELPAPLAARAALAAGRPERARRLEREAGAAAGGEDWGGYWLASARHLAADGEPLAAREALARVAGRWRRGPLLQALALPLADGGGEASPLPGSGPADSPARFALYTSAPADGVVLEVAERQPTALVEVFVDGRLLDVVRARGGRRARAAGEIAPGLHVVEIAPAGGPLPHVHRLAVY
jgi:hypothetical protein